MGLKYSLGRGIRIIPGTMERRGEKHPVKDDFSTIEWWSPTSAAGSASIWTGEKNGHQWIASGSNCPVAATNSLAGFPGLTGDGANTIMSCSTLSSSLSTLSAITITFSTISYAAALANICEYTISSAAQPGAFGISIDTVNTRINGQTRSTARGLSYASQSLKITPHVFSIGLDTALTGGVSFIRHNGVSMPLTKTLTGSVSGLFTTASMFLFARSGLVAGTQYSGTIGDFSIRAGVAEDPALDLIEKFYGSRVGLSW